MNDPDPQLVYVIVHTARTGSHLLASWLESVGLGSPREYFTNETQPDEKLRKFARECPDVLAIKGWLNDVSHVWRTFPHTRIIWLRRGDKLRQAISYFRANESGVWRGGPAGDVPYDERKISNIISMFSCQETQIEATIGSRSPLRIWYEDMLADPAKTVEQVGRFLGCDVDTGRIRTSLRSMSDDTTERWVVRYGQRK